MAAKALNKKNLVGLGAEALADLLLEAVKGDAARQRRVRMVLNAEQSPAEAAAEVRKRFAQIRRAKSWLDGPAQRKLARELTGLIDLIGQRIGTEEAKTGFELLWTLLGLAPPIQERTDDSYGVIGDVMDAAMDAIADLAPRLTTDPEMLAEMVFEALMDNGYGEYDGAIPALGEALGPKGRTRLKALAEAARSTPIKAVDVEGYGTLGDPARIAEVVQQSRDLTLGMILQDVADLEGDVDAWLARYTAEQLTYHTIAPAAALRLLAAGRAEEALGLVQTCLARQEARERALDTPDLDEAHFASLEALGREEELHSALWTRFETRLCVPTLRAYLKQLPDFEDDEALIRAQEHVLAHPLLWDALVFCLEWPDPALGARLVLSRAGELDGDAYEILTPAAEALAPEHPLAAVLIWRSMILFALDAARSSRYGHAARHLASCAAADGAIEDYGSHPDHQSFVQSLRAAHGRKQAFWSRVD
ncbi:DUF6880 family protein [Palleronia caenipelagi]|uniref:Uncharacterized protein n=1 Tax=Palleronia caenipelagi TaxID=2489174 RepID=A0A547PUG9_9RHOB|nr:DUF6880 family protein [Palleronia caenipelagi]TRD17792.1 hypothetical protein FEV53_12535 [Palleronia caenipelagi]